MRKTTPETGVSVYTDPALDVSSFNSLEAPVNGSLEQPDFAEWSLEQLKDEFDSLTEGVKHDRKLGTEIVRLQQFIDHHYEKLNHYYLRKAELGAAAVAWRNEQKMTGGRPHQLADDDLLVWYRRGLNMNRR